MSELLAVIDANNFYVSCERVFNPKLVGKPVIVLSNNDGCVVARSNEAKKLGIKMGQPFFEIADLVKKHNVEFFSSNYKLYADLSSRVMAAIMHYFPEVEIYSIDEAFVKFDFLNSNEVMPYAKKVKDKIKQWTGIPVSIGIAKTKTLAKLANDYAKKHQETENVFNIHSVDDIDKFLEQFPVEDIWGIGGKLSAKFRQAGILTAKDLKYANPSVVDKIAHINGLRTQDELNEKIAYEVEIDSPAKKSITCSRSFGEKVENIEPLETAISNFAEQAALKLREQQSVCRMLVVFLQTSRFDKKLYFNARETFFENYTNYSAQIIEAAVNSIRAIYRRGFRYQKCGVILADIQPENSIQFSLFENEEVRNKKSDIIKRYDKLNAKYGKGTLIFASSALQNDQWKMIRNRLSPEYTTSWKDLLTIKI